MINGIAPFVWILLAAIVLFLPGIAMLLGKGGPRDERGRRTFQFRPVRRLFGLMLLLVGGVSGLLALSPVSYTHLTLPTSDLV